MKNFQDFFEDAAPRWIANAWDITGRSPLVSALWVYSIVEDSARMASAYYLIGDKYYRPHELGSAIPGIGIFHENIRTMYDTLTEITDEGADGIVDKDTIPTRTILRFRPADGDFSADFHYGPLQPGIPLDDMLFATELADAWFARLKETGNDSAAP